MGELIKNTPAWFTGVFFTLWIYQTQFLTMIGR